MAASSQLCLKRGSMQVCGKGFADQLFQPWLWLGVMLMLCNILIFTWVLRQVPLTTAMPFAALVYVLVPLGAQHFFSEYLLPRFYIGVLLIAVGVALSAV